MHAGSKISILIRSEHHVDDGGWSWTEQKSSDENIIGGDSWVLSSDFKKIYLIYAKVKNN